MDQKTVVIQKTKDYHVFKGILGNRDISNKHVAELTASIMHRNMLAYNPIVVNEQMQIVDGQHRFQVAKNNNLDVYYVQLDQSGLEDIQRLNATNLRWQAADYLKSYIALGRTKYIEFEQFITENNLSIQQGLSLIIGDEGGRAYTLAFKRGLLEFDEEDLVKAHFKAGIRQELMPYFVDTGYQRASFFRALNKLVDQGLGKMLLQKIRTFIKPLRSQVTVKDWMRVFEDILNYNRKLEHIALAS